jgi:thiol:disulfide interchange protein
MKSACILFVTALLMGSTDAFMVSPPSSQLRTSLAYASGGALQPPSPSFGSRVIEAVQAPKRTAPTIKARERPPLVEQVMTMEDFKSIVADEKDQIVVVRFYAHWCRVSFLC